MLRGERQWYGLKLNWKEIGFTLSIVVVAIGTRNVPCPSALRPEFEVGDQSPRAQSKPDLLAWV